MNLLNISPDKNAPRSPSIPHRLAVPAARNIIAITKIYCSTLSVYLLKNHLIIIGKSQKSPEKYAIHFTKNRIQNQTPPSPLYLLAITANVSNANNKAIIVAEILIVTAECLLSPYLATIGYATMV